MAASAVLLSLCFAARSSCPSNVGSECTATLVSGLSSYVRDLAVSHDDTMVAVSASTAGLSVYTISTGAAHTVPSYNEAEEAVFSPDSSRLAVAARDEGVAVVTVSTGAQLWIDATKGSCWSVAYSPDGAYVASGHVDGRIYIWNAADGSEVREVRAVTGGHSSRVYGLQYSTDGTKLISGAQGLIVSAVSHGKTFHTIPLTSTVVDVAVSPDGVYAALKSGNTDVSIIKLSDYSTHLTISHGSSVYSLSFNFDSSAILVLGAGESKIYKVSTGTQLAVIDAMNSGSLNFAGTFYNTNNLFVAGDFSGSGSGVYEFDSSLTPAPATPPPATPAPATPAPATPAPATPAPATPAPATPAPATPAPATPAPATPAPATPFPPTPTPDTPAPETSVSQSCDIPDTFAGVCAAGASLRCVLRIQHTGSVLSVAHSADGSEIAAGGSDGKVRVFSAATGAQLRSLVCGGFAAHDVAFSPDGARVAVGGAGGRAVVCDATTGAVLLELEHGDAAAGPVRRVRFSPDGLHLVVGGVEEEVTRVHDAVAGMRAELVLHRHSREVAFVPAASGSGAAARVAAVTVYAEAGEAVRVLAVDNGQQEAAVVSVGARVTPLSFSPNGDELARGMDDGTVRVGLWAGAGTSGSDASTSERLRLQHGSGIVFDVQHSPDGRLVAAAGAGPVVVWGTSGGAAVAELVGHAGAVRRLSFSPDGTRVATAGHDGQLFVWDMTGL